MSDIQISGGSPEAVAFALLQDLKQTEKIKASSWQPDLEWLLDTYEKCLDTAKGVGRH